MSEEGTGMIKKVIDRFTQLIDRQFGHHVVFIDLLNDSSTPPPTDELEAVVKHKKARLIILNNDLVIPITQHHRLYGYVRVFEGLTLHPDKVEQVQMLTDILVRSVVITQHKKHILDAMEDFLKNHLKKERKKPDPQFTQNISSPLCITPTGHKQPVLILASTKESAQQQAQNIYLQSRAFNFLPISKEHQEKLKYPEFITYLGHSTVYIPEITQISLTVQKSLQQYLELQSLYSYKHRFYGPRIIVATTTKPQFLKKLVEKGFIRKKLLCYLSQSKICTSESRGKDIQDLADYLFHENNVKENVIFFKPKKLALSKGAKHKNP